MLYLFNNMEVPTMFFSGGLGAWYHSVSMYAGTNDALVQWWWGHNAVAFVFTVPIYLPLSTTFYPKRRSGTKLGYYFFIKAFHLTLAFPWGD